jgi:hypothetical protein
MRQRRHSPRARVRRVARRRSYDGEDDPLFEEREVEVVGCGDEKLIPSEQ